MSYCTVYADSDVTRSTEQAAAVAAAVDKVKVAEDILMLMVREYLKANGSGVREAARTMGFSAGYMSDVQQGRRKISMEFLRRLERLP